MAKILSPVTLLFLITCVQFVYCSTDNTCRTEYGNSGECLSILKCAPYLSIYRRSLDDPDVKPLPENVFCAQGRFSYPKVCCPLGSTTDRRSISPASTTTASPRDHSEFVAALPEPPFCGLSNASLDRVIGGYSAKLGDFPWMALLGYRGSSGPLWESGGSIITSKHILSAAHCMHNKKLYLVRVGELDLARENEGATPEDIPIKKIIEYHKYSANCLTNDIGILLLEREIKFTALIKPICLPIPPELRSKTYEGSNPLIAGWGHTTPESKVPATHLQAAQVVVTKQEVCKKKYDVYGNILEIDQRVLCAGTDKGGCKGDSGGPLMQAVQNQKDYNIYFYQTGLESNGMTCVKSDFPVIYTRISHFLPWIEEVVLGIKRETEVTSRSKTQRC